MDQKTRKVIIFAIFFMVLVGLVPANIAWAGQLWQTLPTRGPSPTPTQPVQTTTTIQSAVATATLTPSRTATATSQNTPSGSTSTATLTPSLTATAKSQNTASGSTQIATRTSLPAISATAIPSPITAGNEPASPTATILTVNNETATPGTTSTDIQATGAAVSETAIETSTGIPIETAQIASTIAPAATGEKPLSNEQDGKTALPVSLIFGVGGILVIFIGAVIIRILKGNQKPG